MAQERNFRKVRRGYVVSEAMDKTIAVELEKRAKPMMNTTRLILATS